MNSCDLLCKLNDYFQKTSNIAKKQEVARRLVNPRALQSRSVKRNCPGKIREEVQTGLSEMRRLVAAS
jgi:hypothetical protein